LALSIVILYVIIYAFCRAEEEMKEHYFDENSGSEGLTLEGKKSTLKQGKEERGQRKRDVNET
jgi:hypothetical protein